MSQLLHHIWRTKIKSKIRSRTFSVIANISIFLPLISLPPPSPPLQFVTRLPRGPLLDFYSKRSWGAVLTRRNPPHTHTGVSVSRGDRTSSSVVASLFLYSFLPSPPLQHHCNIPHLSSTLLHLRSHSSSTSWNLKKRDLLPMFPSAALLTQSCSLLTAFLHFLFCLFDFKSTHQSVIKDCWLSCRLHPHCHFEPGCRHYLVHFYHPKKLFLRSDHCVMVFKSRIISFLATWNKQQRKILYRDSEQSFSDIVTPGGSSSLTNLCPTQYFARWWQLARFLVAWHFTVLTKE